MDPAPPAPAPTLAELVAGNPDFSTLLVAVEAAGLTNTLQTGGPFTVFAPTNAAFAKIDTMTLNSLLNDPAALSNIILYHVVPGTVESGDVASLLDTDVETAFSGNTIRPTASAEGVGIKVNESVITAVDIEASNGVVHVIDTVLLP